MTAGDATAGRQAATRPAASPPGKPAQQKPAQQKPAQQKPARGPGAGQSRVAVVTGAAGGIGGAICRRLARDGFAVAFLASDGAGYLHGAVLMVDGGGTA